MPLIITSFMKATCFDGAEMKFDENYPTQNLASLWLE